MDMKRYQKKQMIAYKKESNEKEGYRAYQKEKGSKNVTDDVWVGRGRGKVLCRTKVAALMTSAIV